jgi:hypothetical protein
MKNKSKTPFRPYYVIESSGEDIASHGSRKHFLKKHKKN